MPDLSLSTLRRDTRSRKGIVGWMLLACLTLFASGTLLANEDYAAICAGCHDQIDGLALAPSLYGTALSESEFVALVRSGREAMPAFDEIDLSASKVQQIYRYLRSRAPASTPTSTPANTPTGTRQTSQHNPRINNSVTNQITAASRPFQRSALPDEIRQASPEELYRRACSRCHKGIDDPLTELPLNATWAIPDLRFMNLDRRQFERIVTHGHRLMPGFPELKNNNQSDRLYAWLQGKQLDKIKGAHCRQEEIQQTHRRWGNTLYQLHCARCQGRDGEGTAGSAGRDAVPAFSRSVPVGNIRYAIEGHHSAPKFSFLSDSDRFQIANYLSEQQGWASFSSAASPASFKEWNGGKCQQSLCAGFALEADQAIAGNSDPVARPNAGTRECRRYRERNKQKGPAGPGNRYPDCWAQAEVDRYESFCGNYRPGIAQDYPENKRVQAQVQPAVQANTQLRSPWGQKSALLSCSLGEKTRVQVMMPEAEKRPNWQIRVYASLVERSSPKQNLSSGACWWNDAQNTLGEGNPKDSFFTNGITLLVRLPESGRVPERKYWNGKMGVEDQNEPSSTFGKRERAFYEALKVHHGEKTEFTVRVFRNEAHDQTRNPNSCGTCGNSMFSNEPWPND